MLIGEVAERSKALDWNSSNIFTGVRGFESHPLRHGSMVVRVGSFATIRREPRQARKGAAVAVRSGAEVPLARTASRPGLAQLTMSYTALARKWRPRSFAEMTGQEHVLRALSNALGSGRVHHAFLFTGTRGVGKTTVARIFAKCLNCERGVVAEPCGECASCREIDAGRFVDLIEVDAASRTKVDDTRDLLDNVQYAPTRGRYKVYLIDEVHMLSTHSFNALLKTLEEPPPHVKFLLATTDPQKLPVTVLSRCLQFNLKRLSLALIAARLQQILAAEGIEYEAGRGAAAGTRRRRQPARRAVAARPAARLRRRHVPARPTRAPCSAPSIANTWCAWRSCWRPRTPRRCCDYAQQLEERAPDYAQLLEELAALFERVALRQLVPDLRGRRAAPGRLLQRLAGRFTAEDLQLYYQIALLGRRDLALAPDPRTGFRMTLLRMLAFRPADAATPEPQPRVRRPRRSRPLRRRVRRRPAATPAWTPVPRAAPAADWAQIVAQLEIMAGARAGASTALCWSAAPVLVRLALDPRSARYARAAARTRWRRRWAGISARRCASRSRCASRRRRRRRAPASASPQAQQAAARAALESDPTWRRCASASARRCTRNRSDPNRIIPEE